MGKFEDTLDVDNSTEQKRSGKRKHSKIDNLEKAGDAVIALKEKTSKRHKLEAVAENRDDNGNGDVDGKDKKRRKKKIKDVVQTEVHEVSDVPKKKKHRNKTGFPDPNEDESLHDQSGKCLAYAFSQFHRPSKWKFNKACQNWLIRNFWSDAEVPEMYVPLVMAYFAKVQGGARENLLKTCRGALEPPKVAVPSEDLLTSSTPLAPGFNPPLDPDNRKKSRAQAALDALVSSKESLT